MAQENTALDLCGSAIKNLLNHSIKVLANIDNFYDIPDSDASIKFTYKDENFILKMECVEESYNMFYSDPLLVAQDEDYYNVLMDYVDNMMVLFQIAYKFILSNLSNDVIIQLQPYLCPVEMSRSHNLRLINHDNYKVISFVVYKQD
jgi:hypothetical protein